MSGKPRVIRAHTDFASLPRPEVPSIEVNPVRLASCLVVGLGVFVGGVLLGNKQNSTGSVMIIVSATSFRLWMTCEWVVFFHEKRPFIRERRQYCHILGQLLIEICALIGVVAVSIFAVLLTDNNGMLLRIMSVCGFLNSLIYGSGLT